MSKKTNSNRHKNNFDFLYKHQYGLALKQPCRLQRLLIDELLLKQADQSKHILINRQSFIKKEGLESLITTECSSLFIFKLKGPTLCR